MSDSALHNAAVESIAAAERLTYIPKYFLTKEFCDNISVCRTN